MSSSPKSEVWQRGPVEGVPALLQPVAHALLQAEEEITAAVGNMPAGFLWQRPAGVASIAFHIQHITGVLDRLFTYAKGSMLTQKQLNDLKQEGVENESITADMLVAILHLQVKSAIEQIKQTDEKTLTDKRGIGRKQIPTTVLGLLFHSAEHTMRHTGQLLVTAKIISSRA